MRILYFFPYKFSSIEHGIFVRVITILQYLKTKGYIVDMLSMEDESITSSYIIEKKLVNAVYYAGKIEHNYEEYIEVKRNLIEYIIWKIKNQYNKILPKPKVIKVEEKLLNRMNEALIQKLEEVQRNNNYDTLLLTYTYWADLIKYMRLNGFNGKAIIDPTDFLTLQQFYISNPKLSSKTIGEIFGEEIEKVGLYNDIIHISYDEYLLFSSFLPNIRHHFIPQFFEKQLFTINKKIKYDILFIGSINPYNVEGINWFLKEVYPLLNPQISVGIAGKVCDYFELDVKECNISKLGFVEDISALYEISKITICPLKRGTGMKIKVIESLAYGIPVVSTYKGVDGFLNKEPDGGILIGDTAKEFAAQIIKILEDDLYYKKQCDLAIKLFDNNFSIDKNMNKLDFILNQNN